MSEVGVYTAALAAEPSPARKGWIHLFPTGTFSGKDGRGPWRVNDPGAFIAATLAHANGHPIPVDYDHALVAAAEHRTPAPAAGWITQFDARPDGIWGEVEWTARAAEHLAKREYRFISPVFLHTKDGDAQLMTSAALTNQPALNLTAICSTERTRVSPDLDQLCGQLRPLLGLTDTAEPDAIVEAVKGLQTRAAAASVAPARDKFVPIEEFERVTAAFNRQNRGVSQEAAVLAVDREIEAGRLMPSMKDWAVSLCSENRAAFDGFVQRTAGGMQHLFTREASVRGVPSTSDSYAAARMAMQSHVGDAGRLLGVKPDVLVVPPILEEQGRTILVADRNAAGATNIWFGSAKLIVTPWVSSNAPLIPGNSIAGGAPVILG